MASSNNLIAVIPWKRFKWTAEAQWRQSLYTEEEAIRYASQHGCNVVVKFEKRPGPLFDVFQDPDVDCTSDQGYQIVEAVAASDERKSARRRGSIFGSLAGLFKRPGVATGASQEQKA